MSKGIKCQNFIHLSKKPSKFDQAVTSQVQHFLKNIQKLPVINK